MWAKNWGAPRPFWGGGAGPPTVTWAEAYLRTMWHRNPSSHLATTYGPKMGEAVPLWGGVLGPHLTECGPGLPACQVSS